MAATSPPESMDATASVRAFFALVPDEEIRRKFVTLARDVARRSRGRAITGDHVHLTLAFLGDVDAGKLDDLKSVGDHLTHSGAMLEFNGLGAWRASGVAWIAPSEVPAELTALHGELRDGLAAAGFALEARPFRPHVTLARRCVLPHPRAHCAPIRWSVARLCLIGSQLRPEGPLYTELASWPLQV